MVEPKAVACPDRLLRSVGEFQRRDQMASQFRDQVRWQNRRAADSGDLLEQ
jgi:hypothetical protein